MKRVTKSALLAALPAETRALVLRREISIVHPAGPLAMIERTRPAADEDPQVFRAVIK